VKETARRGANIRITGIVQGVGFRPFVYTLAQRLGLAGWVRNTSSGVEMEVDGTPAAIEAFLQALQQEHPPLARLDSLSVQPCAPHGFTRFEIIASQSHAGDFQPIAPDVGICSDCLRELFDPHDRRYRYPFINCTNCGPRFTIITDIPYDRPNTTMAAFVMCPACAAEYHDPQDRRFHAQPVACPQCGPQVWLEPAGGTGRRLASGAEAFRQAQRLLKEGRILAIKGLGGFHLACDATNATAVRLLRQRKLRVDKPFALMMPDIATVERHCVLRAAERQLLEGRQRPIVLLYRRPESAIAEEVAPGQHTLGVMLPYTPLHYLLFADDAHPPALTALPPLVMTSGNLSEEPIATDNDEAQTRLAALADAFLMHDRPIRTRCDDSVVRLVEIAPAKGGHEAETRRFAPYPLRRARGYAPDPLRLPFETPPVLAVGPELKNTFCLTRQQYAFLSHHIGDMENYATLRAFEDSVAHFERLFRITPRLLAHDLHPDYRTTRYARQRAEREALPLVGVQHHHAHIAACLADNGLPGDSPVIGLAFDGTGYGEDGAIWGGEVLLADYRAFQRLYHLAYFPLPGGDAAIRRPARTALALLWALGLDWEDSLPPVRFLPAPERQALRTQLARRVNAPLTSSLGRLFDAAAALAGGRQEVNYEAQAAIEFEAAADPDETTAYPFEIVEEIIDPRPACVSLLADARAGRSLATISARFHNGLVEMVRTICNEIRMKTAIREVALSGGVWQNMVVLQKTIAALGRDGFRVYIHRQVPANDGGVALGQALVAAARWATGEEMEGYDEGSAGRG